MALFQSAFTGTQVEQAVTNALGLDITINPLWPAAVACCISSNDLDTDGGAWKKRCSDKSWYNEGRPSGRYLGIHASETAARAAGGTTGDWYARTTTVSFYQLSVTSGETQIYRAGSREFPAEVAVVAWTDKVVLFDLTQPGCPMWMVFRRDTATTDISFAWWRSASTITASAVGMINGCLCIGLVNISVSASCGLLTVDFPGDRVSRRTNDITLGGTGLRVSDYYHGILPTRLSYPLVATLVCDVAITVLMTAPIDMASRLPVPTIAVATDGGVSVIKDDGNVWDLTCSHASYPYVYKVAFDENNNLSYGFDASGNDRYPRKDKIPTSDVVVCAGPYVKGASYAYYPGAISGAEGAGDLIVNHNNSGKIKRVKNFFGSSSGLTSIKENPSVPSKGMVSYITSKYSSGWLPGAIRGAWLADSVAGIITSADTVADRSFKAKGLSVVGSITKAPVATGASTMGYSGFSETNYLEQGYNTDLDFGTGDFCIMGWVKTTTSNANYIFHRVKSDNTGNYQRCLIVTGTVQARVYPGGSLVGAKQVADGNPHLVCIMRKDGILSINVDGALDVSQSEPNSTTVTDAVLRFGNIVSGVSPFAGTLLMWRASATAPTAEQIKHIYETEKRLFQANAQGILPGTSDAILSLGYDEATEILHGHTSYGRFAFKNLLRVDSEATAVGTPACIAAHDGKIIQGGSAAIKVYIPAFSLREEFAQQAATGNPLGLETYWFVGSAGVTTFVLPIGWKPKFVYNAGLLQRDGAANAYTVTFDGFLYSVVFAVAPTAGNNIGVMAVRS